VELAFKAGAELEDINSLFLLVDHVKAISSGLYFRN